MTRDDLIALLQRYADRHPEELATANRILALVASECAASYATATRATSPRPPGSSPGIAQGAPHPPPQARPLAPAGRTHRRRVRRPPRRPCARRGKSRELPSSSPLPGGSEPRILDVDVHEIPARKTEPAHQHHDIRFLLETSEHAPLARQRAESKALRWFPAAGIEGRFSEESLARMARKAALWLALKPSNSADPP